jgi:hypothetical protein
VRLPFPERIPFTSAFFFALFLCAIQLLEGTSAIFSLCCLGFILVATIAFNFAGGFSRSTGGYVFFFAVLVVLIGLVWKAILGEPADSNIQSPLVLIEIYLASMCGMLVAVIISKKLTTKRPLLSVLSTDDNLQTATIGCMVTGLLLFVLGVLVPREPGSLFSALNQVNHFLPLAVILGVIHTIRRSGGTRSINLPVVISCGLLFSTGLIGFSKEGMITPFVCWFLGAASERYKVSRAQIVGAIFMAIFLFQYLFPFAQYGRAFRADTFSENVDVAIGFFSDLGEVRRQYLETQEFQDESYQGYFNTHQGFFDRLQMIGPDSVLVAYTQQNGPLGLYPVVIYFENLVPHFIWPDKPFWGGGNLYAREIGVLSEEDTSTGISFSPAGESFRLGSWAGVLLVDPILWTVLFVLFESLCGDVRKSPWGLIVMLVYAHLAPEGGIGGVIYMMGYVAFGVWFCAFMGTYLMPIVGEVLIGPRQAAVRSINAPWSRPNRLRSIDATDTANL